MTVPSWNLSSSTILDFGIRGPDRSPRGLEANPGSIGIAPLSPNTTYAGSSRSSHQTCRNRTRLRWHAPQDYGGLDVLEEKTESLKRNIKAGSGRRVRWPQLPYFGLSVLCSKSGLGHLSKDSTLLCRITDLDRSTAGAAVGHNVLPICRAALVVKACEGYRCYYQRRRGSGSIIQRYRRCLAALGNRLDHFIQE